MTIKFNKVTWYSITAAIVLYIGTFALAFYLGLWTGSVAIAPTVVQPASQVQPVVQPSQSPQAIINSATFACDNNKSIQAIFFKEKVELTLSDKRTMLLNQAISASGARYANSDESFVFWNKGNTAFVQEGNATTYQNCVTGK